MLLAVVAVAVVFAVGLDGCSHIVLRCDNDWRWTRSGEICQKRACAVGFQTELVVVVVVVGGT